MKTFTLDVLEHSGCRYLPLKSSSFLYEKKKVEFIQLGAILQRND